MLSFQFKNQHNLDDRNYSATVRTLKKISKHMIKFGLPFLKKQTKKTCGLDENLSAKINVEPPNVI